MLIDGYRLEVLTPECDLQSPVYMAKVFLDANIAEALPYVNAAVERAEYVSTIPSLVWKENARRYVLRAREITIFNLVDRAEAEEVVTALVARLNVIWKERDKLEASYASWKKPKALEIFKLLPRTNCGRCGRLTCMAYAAKLATGKSSLGDCSALGEPGNAESLNALHRMGI